MPHMKLACKIPSWMGMSCVIGFIFICSATVLPHDRSAAMHNIANPAMQSDLAGKQAQTLHKQNLGYLFASDRFD